MSGPLSGIAGQAIPLSQPSQLNGTQNVVEQRTQINPDATPQGNETQPTGTATAQSQESFTGNAGQDNASELFSADAVAALGEDAPRGSLIDVLA